MLMTQQWNALASFPFPKNVTNSAAGQRMEWTNSCGCVSCSVYVCSCRHELQNINSSNLPLNRPDYRAHLSGRRESREEEQWWETGPDHSFPQRRLASSLHPQTLISWSRVCLLQVAPHLDHWALGHFNPILTEAELYVSGSKPKSQSKWDGEAISFHAWALLSKTKTTSEMPWKP